MVVYTPSFLGHSGDAVNERQLIFALCRELWRRYKGNCLVFSQIPVLPLLRLHKLRTQLKSKPANTVVLPMPIIGYPPLLGYVLGCFIGFFIIILVRLLYGCSNTIVYIRGSWNALGSALFSSLRKRLVVKLGAILEDEFPSRTPFRKSTKMFIESSDRIVLQNAGVIAVSSQLMLKNLVLRRRIFPRGRITVVPPGIDRKIIAEVMHSKLLLKDSNRKEYVVGFIGNLAWWQGVDILVEAVAKLKNYKLDKSVRLLIIGGGPERKRVERLCRHYKLDCSITGFMDHKKALEYLASLDVLVVPSKRISSMECNVPIKIIEAWTLGTPIIVTKHQVFEYMGLKNGEHLVFCQPHPDDVAEKIATVLKSKMLKNRLSMNGIKLAEKFAYENIAKNLLSILISD